MQETTDAPENTNTPYSLSHGQTFSGTISSGGDTDWIAVDLVADTPSLFKADWVIADMDRAKYDLNLYMRDNAGVGWTYADYEPDTEDWTLAFRPEETGRYYLSFDSSNNNEGTYSVTWANRADGMEVADAPANTTTTYRLSEAQPFEGYLGGQDQGDWLRTSLVANQIYELSVSLDVYDRTYHHELEDVTVEIRSASGTLLAEAEVDYTGTVRYVVSEATEAFIGIRQSDPADSGGYELSLAKGALVPVATPAEAAAYLTFGYWRDYYAALNAQTVARDGPNAPLQPLPTQAKALPATGRRIEVDTSDLNAVQSQTLFDALQVWTDATGLEFYEGDTLYDLVPKLPGQFTYNGMIGVTPNDSGSSVGRTTSDFNLFHSAMFVQTSLLSEMANGNSYAADALHKLIAQAIGLGALSAPAADGSAFVLNGDKLNPQVFQFDGPQMSLMHTRGPDQNLFIDYTNAPAAGPMTLDILAVERLYGAGPDVMTGDTVWGVGTNVANSSAALFEAFASGTGAEVFYTIVDDGGTDVLSFAGSDKPNRIDLGTGKASDIGGTLGTLVIMSGSVIERAIGGEAADDITGNAVNNRLEGRGGGDSLQGQGGDDFLLGDTMAAAYYGSSIANQVYRLYQATLDRAPDAGGHAAWTGRIANGERTLLEAIDGFVRSPQFKANYSDNMSNTDFVTLLYNNVLGREPDADGLANWSARMDAGMSRAEVVLGFSQSPQFQGETNAAANSYAMGSMAASWSDDVYRLYRATLDREPDMIGQDRWTGELANGQSTLEDVADGFVRSPQFKAIYSDNLSDTDFVTLLYNNVLDVAVPDAGGLARWVGELEGGASRAEVVLGFSQSPQFRGETQEALKAWVRDQGTHDTIIAGSGNNTVAGGQYADVFVFNAGEAGSTSVRDLEAWDYINLNGFGYGGAAQARGEMSQAGSDVVFADQGVQVTFENTLLGEITDDMIWV